MIRLTQDELIELIAFVKVNYGIDLSGRKTFVEMRLQKLMQESRFDNFSDYFAYVCSDTTGMIVSNFISNLTISYTLFYRESLHFEFLVDQVLPELIKKERKNKDLRIWSAGCATGEEAYTIAMVLADFLDKEKPFWDTKVLATDISAVALGKAVAGTYPIESIQELNPHWIKDYFVPDPEDNAMMRVAPTIKDEVIFRRLNLVAKPFPFKSKFHFIFCRNVMIYFDDTTKNKLLNWFYDVLEDGGYLFIGMSETIEKNATKFKYIKPSIYRKEGK